MKVRGEVWGNVPEDAAAEVGRSLGLFGCALQYALHVATSCAANYNYVPQVIMQESENAFSAHEPLLADLDLETRVMLSQVYLEACRELDTPSKSIKQLDKLRSEIGNRVIQSALAGERDPAVTSSST